MGLLVNCRYGCELVVNEFGFFTVGDEFDCSSGDEHGEVTFSGLWAFDCLIVFWTVMGELMEVMLTAMIWFGIWLRLKGWPGWLMILIWVELQVMAEMKVVVERVEAVNWGCWERVLFAG
jgi:hypothetical protein